jgi:hypothetical protein
MQNNLIIIKAKYPGKCSDTLRNFSAGDLVIYDKEAKKTFLILETKNIYNLSKFNLYAKNNNFNG